MRVTHLRRFGDPIEPKGVMPVRDYKSRWLINLGIQFHYDRRHEPRTDATDRRKRA